MVQTEMYGADEEVNVFVQKKNKYEDLTKAEDGYALPKMYLNVPFSHTFWIPAEYDIYIQFAPMKNLPGKSYKTSKMGKFTFKT